MPADIVTRIRARCRDDAGCWIWQHYATGGTTPVINIKGTPTTVRRLVYEAAIGPVKPGHEVVNTCEQTLCCNPECLEQITVAARRRRLAEKRNVRQPASFVRHIRETHGKLDMEKARAIRASEEQSKVLAARYGVSSTLIGYVRRGVSWAEPSPFAGLGARA